MILGEIRVQTKQSRRNGYNAVKGVFLSEEDNYVLADYPAQLSKTTAGSFVTGDRYKILTIDGTDFTAIGASANTVGLNFTATGAGSGSGTASLFLAEDDEQIYLDMPLPLTVNNIRAQRLARLALLRSRQQEAITMACNLSALRFNVGDNINITNARLGYSQKVFEVTGYSTSFDSSGEIIINVQAIETASSVWDWSSTDEEVFLGGGEVDLYDGSFTERPASISVAADSYMGEDGTFRPYFSVTWPASVDAFVDHYIVEWRTGTGDYLSQATRTSPFQITNLQDGASYNVRVKAVNGLGVQSITRDATPTAATDATAPDVPTSVSAVGEYRQITISWTKPTQKDLLHVEVFRSPTGGPNSFLYVGNGDSSFIDTDLETPKTYYYKVRSCDRSFNKSVYADIVSATSRNVTITAPDNSDVVIYDGESGIPPSVTTAVATTSSDSNTFYLKQDYKEHLELHVSYPVGALTSGTVSGETNAINAVMSQFKFQIYYAPTSNPTSFTQFGSDLISQRKTTTGQLISNYFVKTTDLGSGNYKAELQTKTQVRTAYPTLSGYQLGVIDDDYNLTEITTVYDFPSGEYVFKVVVTVTDGSYSPYPSTGSPSSTLARTAKAIGYQQVEKSGYSYAFEPYYQPTTIFRDRDSDEVVRLSDGADTLELAAINAQGKPRLLMIGPNTTNPSSGVSWGASINFVTSFDSYSNGGLGEYQIGIDKSGTGLYLGSGGYRPQASGGSELKITNGRTDVFGDLYLNGVEVGTGSGSISGVTAGTNLNGGGTSGTVTLNLDSTITGDHTFEDNLVIEGNLTVQGTTTTVDTDDLNVKDKNITLNYSTGDSSANANGAGITIQDAVNSTTNATILWDSTNDEFDFSHNITAPNLSISNWNTAYGWGNPSGVYLPLAGGTLTGGLSGTTASFSSTLSVNGKAILNRANGSVGAPNTANHDTGTRIELYNADATSWYAIGIESNTMWFNSDNYYKFYVDAVSKVDFSNTGVVNAVGGYKVNGTTVIDASRNVSSINLVKFRDHTSSFYISPTNANTLNAQHDSNADTADMWINYRGYNDTFSNFRDFRIGNGKGAELLHVDGSAATFTFSGTISSGAITAEGGATLNGVGTSSSTYPLRVFNGASTPDDLLSIKDDGTIIMDGPSAVVVNKGLGLSVSASLGVGGQIYNSSGDVEVFGDFKIASGGLKMGTASTTIEIIDASRNLTNLGVINGANQTSVADRIGNIKIARKHVTSGTNPVTSIDNLETFILSKTDGGYGSGTKPSGADNSTGIISLQTHTGNYFTQLALSTATNDLFIRSAHAATSYGSYQKLLKESTNITVGTISSGAITSSGNLKIYKTGDDSVINVDGNSGYDPVVSWRSDQQSSVAGEGFQIWYDNSVGDVHLHTTYANDVAAIRFHTRTGTDKATNNERFTINGNGNINIVSGTLSMGNTEIIDASRNITAGTISSGAITATSAYGGGSGDYINVTTPPLRIDGSTTYWRIPHESGHASVSGVYGYETGKNVYWGEPSDTGKYYFRGRDLSLESAELQIAGTTVIDTSRIFYAQTRVEIQGSGGWAYTRLKNVGSVMWDIAANPVDNSSALQFRPFGSGTNATLMSTSGNWTINGTISSGAISIDNGSQRVKYGVWSGTTYGVGMGTGYTYGAINNDYVMSFQMNDDSDRGFWWGDTGHGNDQGAMALSTDGYLTVASGLRLGFGESDTTHPSAGLQVNGTITSTGDISANSGKVRMGNPTLLSGRSSIRIDSDGDSFADLVFGNSVTSTSWTNANWAISSRSSSESNSLKIYRGSGQPSPYNSEHVLMEFKQNNVVSVNSTLQINNTTVIDASRNATFATLDLGTSNTSGKPLSIQSTNSAYGTLRIYNDSTSQGETGIGLFGKSNASTNVAWVMAEGGWGAGTDFVIGNENGGAGGNIRLQISRSGNVNVKTGSLLMGGTTVINASKEIKNVPLIFFNGGLQAVDLNNSDSLIFDTPDGHSALLLSGGTMDTNYHSNTTHFFRGTDLLDFHAQIDTDGISSFGNFKIGSTTVIDASRKATFAASGTGVVGLEIDVDVGASITLGNDTSYGATGGGRYTTLGFGGTGNGTNRIFALNTALDGLYICSATSRNISFRTNGSGSDAFTMTAAGLFLVGGTTVIDASRNLINVQPNATDAEYGISMVGNFGQWQHHSAYSSGFNVEPTYWGWNYVQGNANAPNTSSNQWYRNRVSLGNQYGKGTSAGDYWCEMAYPRYNQSTAGHMWMRVCEGGSVGSWSQVGSNIIGDFTTTGGINVGDAKTVGHGAISLKYDLVYMTAGVISPSNSDGTDNDNAIDLGKSAARFNDIFATNGTIQTSDRNEKQDIESLTEAEERVAIAAKGLLKKFRWKSSVVDKGDDARIHFGIIAQDLQDAFEAEGLDAGRYAMFTSDTWTDDDGVEKTRLGVRYNQLLAFIISAI